MIELLTVIAILMLLAGLLFPVVERVKGAALQAKCASNLRQLYLANVSYAHDEGHYVAASPDILSSNRLRWHGSRTSSSAPFDGTGSPLAPYLGETGEILQCPAFHDYSNQQGANAFEASCGGYGYNAVGVGSEIYRYGFCSQAMQQGMRPEDIREPSRTVMFADAAFPQPYGSNPTLLIEYSFIEPYHWVFSPGVESQYRADPSIHFRHRGRANVMWCDGHVSAERMETFAEAHFTKWDIGWFGPSDNSLFDPY